VNRELVLDVLLAAVLALVVLVLGPGLAVAAIVALVMLVVLGAGSLLVRLRRGRRRGRLTGPPEGLELRPISRRDR
jgi:O-antigen ligase